MITKKIISFLFFLLLSFSYSISSEIPKSIFSGNVVNAGDYPTIQDAVNALPEEGGTVFIPARTYKIFEPIVITKSDVTLMGAGAGTLLLNINEEGKNTIEILGEKHAEADTRKGKGIWHVQVCNMHLKGNEKCGNGIYAYYVNEISLREMWIDYHGKSGIHLYYCYENPRIADNNIAYNKEKGVYIEGCHDIVISANEMEENGTGVFIKDIFNATITGNNIDDHIDYCIHFVNAAGSIITGNMLENCNKLCVLLDENCDGTVLTGNTFRQPGDIRIIKNHGVTITGNAFDMTKTTALEIEESNLITVSGNIFTNGPQEKYKVYGIIMKNVNDVSISGNTIVKPEKGGIYLLGDENKYVNITGNTIKNPSIESPGEFSGIFLQNTWNSVISHNIVIDDRDKKLMKYAIEEVGNSNYNIIVNNHISKGLLKDIFTIGVYTKEEGNIVH